MTAALLEYQRVGLTMDYIFIPPNGHTLPGWPIYMDHSHDAPVLGMLRQQEPFAVTQVHDFWLRVRQKNGPIGWAAGIHGNSKQRVLVPMNSQQAQQYIQRKTSPTARQSFQKVEGMGYENNLQNQQRRQGKQQHKSSQQQQQRQYDNAPTRQQSHKVKSYGWQRARATSKNYGDILEKRRTQLRQVDLAEHAVLLEEWYELIKELDAVFRYGYVTTPTFIHVCLISTFGYIRVCFYEYATLQE